MSEDDEFYNLLKDWQETDKPSSDYVRFDERKDVLASLDLLALITPFLNGHPAYWKWAIIGAHDALQGAMVCALADSTGTSVLEKRSQIKMLEWLDNRTDNADARPDEYLAPFMELLKRCLKQPQLLTLESQQIKDICNLHRHFRNNFAHFTPKGWGIEKAGLPRIIGAAVNAIEQLMNQHKVLSHLEEDEQQRLANSLKSTRASLEIP